MPVSTLPNFRLGVCWLAAIVLIASATSAFAQASTYSLDSLALAPQPISQDNVLAAPSRDYTGLPVGGWLLFPSVSAGVAFNDNLYQTDTNRTAAAAWRIVPSLVAKYSTGLQNLTLYGAADAYVYNSSASNADTVNGRVGFQDVWNAAPDLVFNFAGEASQNTDMSNGAGTVPGATIQPVHYQQYVLNASALKSFDRLFVGLQGAFLNDTYDNARLSNGGTLSQAYRDFNGPSVTARLGYWVAPDFYTFVEGVGNLQDYYNNSFYDSHGYRADVGVGTSRFGLFKGEIYAGYQEQFYSAAAFGNTAAPAFGAKLFWYPTPYLTLTAKADQSSGTATYVSASNTVGSPTHVTSASLSADYALAQTWSARAHVDYSYTAYVGNPRIDNLYSVGATLNYEVWRNLSATLDYQFASLQSSVGGVSYNQNILSLGVTYKY